MEGEDDATDPQIFPPEEEEENEEHQLSYKKIKKEALAPVFGSEGAVGADLHSAEECVVPAKGLFFGSSEFVYFFDFRQVFGVDWTSNCSA